MVPLVMCFLCEFTPSNIHVVHVCHPCAVVCGDRQVTGACRSARLAESVSSKFKETLSHYRYQPLTSVVTTYTHTHDYVHTCLFSLTICLCLSPSNKGVKYSVIFKTFFQNLFYYFYIRCFACVHAWCSETPAEVTEYPGTGVTDSCELTFWFWE